MNKIKPTKFYEQVGASMLEAAIVVPLVLIVLFGAIDVGFFLYSTNALKQSAHRALTMASWIPGLESTEGSEQYETAKITLKSKSFDALNASNITKGFLKLKSEPDIKVYDLDTSSYNDSDAAIVVGLPAVDLETQSRPFNRKPIAVRINATYRSMLLGWVLPAFSIHGEARGFREKQPALGVPVPQDCMGRPYNYPHTKPPTPEECCQAKGGASGDPCCQIDAVVNPITGLCGGCPPNYKVISKPVGTSNNFKPQCVCDVNSLGCGEKYIVDEVNCKCTDKQCPYQWVRRPDNTCGCPEVVDKGDPIKNLENPTGCGWNDLCSWVLDSATGEYKYQCKNGWQHSYDPTANAGVEYTGNGTVTCGCDSANTKRGWDSVYCKCLCISDAWNPNPNGTCKALVCTGENRVANAEGTSCVCSSSAPKSHQECLNRGKGEILFDCACACPYGKNRDINGNCSDACSGALVPIINPEVDKRVACCPQCQNGLSPMVTNTGARCACGCPPCYTYDSAAKTCVKSGGTGQEGGGTGCS